MDFSRVKRSLTLDGIKSTKSVPCLS
jgi:hypothetical protein